MAPATYMDGTYVTPTGAEYRALDVTDVSYEAYEQFLSFVRQCSPAHLGGIEELIPKIDEGYIHDTAEWRPKPLLICKAPPGMRRAYQPRTVLSLGQKYRQKRKMRLQSL